MEKGGSLKKKVHHWLPPSKELQYSKITISQALFGYHGCILSTSQPDFLEFHIKSLTSDHTRSQPPELKVDGKNWETIDILMQ